MHKMMSKGNEAIPAVMGKWLPEASSHNMAADASNSFGAAKKRMTTKIMTVEYISNFSAANAMGLLTLVKRGRLVAIVKPSTVQKSIGLLRGLLESIKWLRL
jgi:hypothetical protein